jgi:methionine-rich copper-binding protein CopC
MMLHHTVIIGALLAPVAAFAHALLVHSDPPVGSRVATAPPLLTLNFSERVEPLFTHVQVLDQSGRQLSTGEPRASNEGRSIVISIPKLQPGRYTVIWHATSVDTHKTEGQYNFSVGP